MSRYIDANEALRMIRNSKQDCPLVDDKRSIWDVAHNCAISCVEAIPGADVVENKEGQVLLPLTEEELRHLKNDTIAYIWRMENDGRNKEEFGYFSRKELLKKLEWFLKMFEKPVCRKE